jgi:hypothetical protein
MKFDSSSLKAAPSTHPSSKHPSSEHQVSQALMSCLFDSTPDPNQVGLGGLHPGVSSVHLSRRQWPTAFLPGKARRSRPLRWHHLPGRPKRAPTPAGPYDWSRSACGRGALAPLRTLRLCGDSSHSQHPVGFQQLRSGRYIEHGVAAWAVSAGDAAPAASAYATKLQASAAQAPGIREAGASSPMQSSPVQLGDPICLAGGMVGGYSLLPRCNRGQRPIFPYMAQYAKVKKDDVAARLGRQRMHPFVNQMDR